MDHADPAGNAQPDQSRLDWPASRLRLAGGGCDLLERSLRSDLPSRAVRPPPRAGPHPDGAAAGASGGKAARRAIKLDRGRLFFEGAGQRLPLGRESGAQAAELFEFGGGALRVLGGGVVAKVFLGGSDAGVDGGEFAFDQGHAVFQLLQLDGIQALDGGLGGLCRNGAGDLAEFGFVGALRLVGLIRDDRLRAWGCDWFEAGGERDGHLRRAALLAPQG